jgi:ABC-2 type transport system permease protein
MTAVSHGARTELHQSFVRQTLRLSRRAVLNVARQPALFAPAMVFPLFFAALSSSSFSRAIQLPNFPPVDSFLQFILAGTLLQGVLFGSVQGGADMATDIERGFFERLIASPVSRVSILVGRLGGAAATGAAQAVVFVAVFSLFGAKVEGGIAGVAVLVVAASMVALAFGGFMNAIAIRTGSTEAVQGSFPLVFALLFLSSTFFPRETMSGWFKRVADLNPVSHIVEGMRAIVIEGLSAGAVTQAILLPIAIGALSTGLALLALRSRLAAR